MLPGNTQCILTKVDENKERENKFMTVMNTTYYKFTKARNMS